MVEDTNSVIIYKYTPRVVYFNLDFRYIYEMYSRECSIRPHTNKYNLAIL